MIFSGFASLLAALLAVSEAAQGNDWIKARSPAGGHHAEEKSNRTG
jgi:hypothetical protein